MQQITQSDSGIIYYSGLPPIKDYFQPKSLNEALSFLASYGKYSKILAGGTDLLALMRARYLAPDYLIDISRIKELDYIRHNLGGMLEIGALATLHSIELSSMVKENYPALHEAIYQMGTTQIRNMGTLVGNICRASPAADSAPVLLALEAEVEIASTNGTRILPLDRFFLAPGETALKDNEMVTGIRVPPVNRDTGMSFLRLSRTASDLAKINAASVITVERGFFQDVRIALGSVAPTPIRARKAEGKLKGKKVEYKMIEEAARTASEEISPISDIRSTAEYRKEMSAILIKRTINIALQRINIVL